MLAIYANSIHSAHEAALESRNTTNSRLWGQSFAIENMLDTISLLALASEQKSAAAGRA
jgi:hypothetical protein